jgi:hypothetical protein
MARACVTNLGATARLCRHHQLRRRCPGSATTLANVAPGHPTSDWMGALLLPVCTRWRAPRCQRIVRMRWPNPLPISPFARPQVPGSADGDPTAQATTGAVVAIRPYVSSPHAASRSRSRWYSRRTAAPGPLSPDPSANRGTHRHLQVHPRLSCGTLRLLPRQHSHTLRLVPLPPTPPCNAGSGPHRGLSQGLRNQPPALAKPSNYHLSDHPIGHLADRHLPLVAYVCPSSHARSALAPSFSK